MLNQVLKEAENTNEAVRSERKDRKEKHSEHEEALCTLLGRYCNLSVGDAVQFILYQPLLLPFRRENLSETIYSLSLM